ncbi:MAG: hypothetical protein UIH27_11040 [Ruminococcus sp.]|nr:hypothetical protein [Ruminococcus sp.]
MKIKKAIDICKKSKMIGTFYADDEQWVTNGEAAFSVPGICRLTEEYICALYDINDNQREKIQFKINCKTPDVISRGDIDPAETEAQVLKIGVDLDGLGLCIPLKTEQGIIFIQRRYLEPLLDVPESELLFFKRTTDDGKKTFIAVKIGLLLYAIIAPVIINDEIVRTLENLYTAAKIANYNNSGGTT